MVLLVDRSMETLYNQVLIECHVADNTQTPSIDPATQSLVFFFKEGMTDGPHKIDITVTTASGDNPYIIDYFLVFSNSNSVPTPGPATSTPSSSVIIPPTPIGAIVGGVVGGIAGIALLFFALWYFFGGRSRGSQAHYPEKRTAGNIFDGECSQTSP